MLGAAARLGLAEDRFWRLTPRQMKRIIDAYTEKHRQKYDLEKARHDAAMYRTAWIVATTMNFAGKMLPKGIRIDPDELINGPRFPEIDDMEAVRKRINRQFRVKERFGYEI